MRIVLTAIAFIFTFVCLSQTPPNDEDYELLKGKVKKIRFSWDRSLDATELRTQDFNADWYDVDTFNDIGYKIGAYHVKDGIAGKSSRREYKFDDKGKMIEIYYSYEDGARRRLFTYDSTGNIVEQINFINGNFIRHVKYFYTSGLLTTETDSTTEEIQKTFYKNLDNGKKIEKTTSGSSGQESLIQYRYDDKGNKISERWESGYNATFVYDEYNNEILRKLYDDKGRAIRQYTKEYIYDSQGNWIRCIDDTSDDFGDPMPAYSLVIREIEYY